MATHSNIIAWEILCMHEARGSASLLSSPERGTRASRHFEEGEGNEGFPPPPDKDLDSPSSKCLEALVPLSGLKSNDALPLALRMQTWLP